MLFVQALDIPEKVNEKKVGWIYNLLKDVSYLLGAVMKDQARNILAGKKIESFLMATDSIVMD
ncbi:hypothetical protein G9A89_016023 [Geosiphon pyriformis]|nr:hypothetical protein G9A89_016023 [Geosiphon pyriformis]